MECDDKRPLAILAKVNSPPLNLAEGHHRGDRPDF